MLFFVFCGKFKKYEMMDLYFKVSFLKKWIDMIRYNSFVCKCIVFFL